MKIIKNVVRRVFAHLGFQIVRIEKTRVQYESFVNLAKFAEYKLKPNKDLCLPDKASRYEFLAKLQGTPPTEAYHILYALEECKDLDGDVCEFGVAEGDTSALIANEMLDGEKAFHIFDSFEGLPMPGKEDELIDDIFSLGSMEAYAGKMSFSEASVKSKLEFIEFPQHRTIIHKGFVPQVFHQNNKLPSKVSVAYVDFDFFEPIKSALEFLDEVLLVGGIIVIDDYGFFSAGAKTAVDQWVDSVNIQSVRYELEVPEEIIGKFAVVRKVAD